MSRRTYVLNNFPQILFILAACLAMLALSSWAWPFDLPADRISEQTVLRDPQRVNVHFTPADLSLLVGEAAEGKVNLDGRQAGGP